MHPIERLRWIARAHGESAATLAAEAAWTFSELALDEPPALLTACRRLLESHVTAGPLWWVAATVLVAPEPDQAARRAVEEICSDPTAELLGDALGQHAVGQAPIVVLCPADTVKEALGHLPAAVVRVVGSSPELRGEVRGFAAVADECGGWEFDEATEAVRGAALLLAEAMAAGPRGVLLDTRAVPVLRTARAAGVPVWVVGGVGRLLNDQLLGEMQRRAAGDAELVEPGGFDLIVGPAGLESPGDGLGHAGCPVVPELLVRAG